MLRCARCHQEKSRESFGTTKLGKAKSYCRPCAAEYSRQWQAAHPGYAKEKGREWESRQKGARKAAIISKYGSMDAYLRARKRPTFQERYAADPEFRERHREKTRRSVNKNRDEYLARKRERGRRKREGFGDLVYFIQATTGGPIKIGYTSQNPEARLIHISVGAPVEYQIIGVLYGGRKEESDLHYRFQHLKQRGEWFRAEPELREFISANTIPWTAQAQGETRRTP